MILPFEQNENTYPYQLDLKKLIMILSSAFWSKNLLILRVAKIILFILKPSIRMFIFMLKS